MTAKNSELYNHTIDDKQQIDYQISKLKLNFKLDGVVEWNEKKIVDRADALIKSAKIIWPYPKTDFVKETLEEQKFDLTSEDSFSYTNPTRLFFDDDEKGIELKYWRDLLSCTCNFLYDYSPI